MWVKNYSEELYHHGIKGQKWGVRRFQNKDGSLTNAGKRRQLKLQDKLDKNVRKQTLADNKLLDLRAKNRTRWESKYDKKISKYSGKNEAKVNKITNKKEKFLKEYDLDTKAIKTAQKIGNENHNKILKLKIKAISDPSIKKSESYKQAKLWASSQKLSEMMYGKTYTQFQEAQYARIHKARSWTRGNLEE